MGVVQGSGTDAIIASLPLGVSVTELRSITSPSILHLYLGSFKKHEKTVDVNSSSSDNNLFDVFNEGVRVFSICAPA